MASWGVFARASPAPAAVLCCDVFSVLVLMCCVCEPPCVVLSILMSLSLCRFTAPLGDLTPRGLNLGEYTAFSDAKDSGRVAIPSTESFFDPWSAMVGISPPTRRANNITVKWFSSMLRAIFLSFCSFSRASNSGSVFNRLASPSTVCSSATTTPVVSTWASPVKLAICTHSGFEHTPQAALKPASRLLDTRLGAMTWISVCSSSPA